MESLEERALLATFTVTTTADSGPGSLPHAMVNADSTPNTDQDGDGLADPDRIEFNIGSDDARHFYYRDDGQPGVTTANITTTTLADDADLADENIVGTGNTIDPDWPHSWFSIQPGTQLPDITQPVVIDGYTQPGTVPNSNTVDSGLGLNSELKIELDGSQFSGSGIILDGQDSAGSSIRGLVLNRFFSRAIYGFNTGFNRIEGNFLGTDVSGTIGLGRQTVGVEFRDTAANRSNVVGGLSAEARNLISGSQGGVSFFNTGFSNQVLGNLIGTDISGTIGIGHTQYGVNVHGVADTVIGGTEVNARNVISASFRGVYIQAGASSTNTLIQGNYIGTDVSGTQPLGNTRGIQDEGVGTRIGRVDGAGEQARTSFQETAKAFA